MWGTYSTVLLQGIDELDSIDSGDSEVKLLDSDISSRPQLEDGRSLLI
jgi:hypothetical protein